MFNFLANDSDHEVFLTKESLSYNNADNKCVFSKVHATKMIRNTSIKKTHER